MKYNLNKIYALTLPIWMKSRINLFIFFCLDFTLFLYIKNQLYADRLTFRLISFNLCLTILWCLISYINGRYSNFKNIKNIFKKVYKLITATLITLTIIYILDKLIIILFPDLIPFGKDRIIFLGITSFSIQVFKTYPFRKITLKNKIFILGNDMEKKIFKEFLNQFSISKNFNIIDFSTNIQKPINNQTILILGEESDKKNINYIYENFLSLNAEILSPFNWCEKNLQRIPLIYLCEKEYQSNDWIIDSESFEWRLKRFGDITISLILLIISGPIIIIASFIIKIEDRGPVFYNQIRTGLGGKEFKITKLRTMKTMSEKNGPVWATKDDNRITKIGSILRKTRIDELPQLLSVLKGDMSLIGPRPERPEIEILLKRNIPYYDLRKVIRPGLSGWAQVNYPYGASLKDSENKLSYELFYIRNYSFWLDLLIFIKTIKLIFNMKGSSPNK